MQLKRTGTAGTMESSDIMVSVVPGKGPGLEVTLSSTVMEQFGRQIEGVIRQTLAELGVEEAAVDAVDHGALDCTVKARVQAAVWRASQSNPVDWGALT